MRANIFILSIAMGLIACNSTSNSDNKPEPPQEKLSAKQYADSGQHYWELALTQDSMYVDKAVEMQDSAIKIEPANVMHRYVKANYLSQMGQYQAALDIYTHIVANHEVDFGTYTFIGMLYYRLGETDSSEKYINLSHQSILARIEKSEDRKDIFQLKLRDAILLIMQDKKAEAINMLESITPADEDESRYLNSQIATLKSKSKDDLVEDMLPVNRSWMFERNKQQNDTAIIQ